MTALLILAIFFRFGIINALASLQEIAKGEEYYASYGYSFDAGAPWYKDLFLEFMAENPDDPKVQQLSLNRTKEELLKSYDQYMKTIPGVDSEPSGKPLNGDEQSTTQNITK